MPVAENVNANFGSVIDLPASSTYAPADVSAPARTSMKSHWSRCTLMFHMPDQQRTPPITRPDVSVALPPNVSITLALFSHASRTPLREPIVTVCPRSSALSRSCASAAHCPVALCTWNSLARSGKSIAKESMRPSLTAPRSQFLSSAHVSITSHDSNARKCWNTQNG